MCKIPSSKVVEFPCEKCVNLRRPPCRLPRSGVADDHGNPCVTVDIQQPPEPYCSFASPFPAFLQLPPQHTQILSYTTTHQHSPTMPFVAAEQNKCGKCGKSVYPAEERIAGSAKWHKTCFKCGLCNKLLDSTNVSEHGGELFCRQCYGRKFGPKGVGFGGGAGALSMDVGEQFGNKSSEMTNAHHSSQF
ncbi:putative Muscle LIM protein 1 [Hypsibius exemplaris]|uniref:Muscle LIM protein 1 n=1 Tax=Hypsibius exemplaris TaxID=2072580 RepID=A0A9X6NE55_HYPEX|nr:putative Muscle LIM protein 1 [Hypsibius exemplaris]